jgi:hypothetical protein
MHYLVDPIVAKIPYRRVGCPTKLEVEQKLA